MITDNNKKNNKYDLEERTAKFGEDIIDLCQNIQQCFMNRPILNQLLRSGTSIGANYMEANGASSKKDFRNKIYICKKEAQETKHWLRMMKKAVSSRKQKIEYLANEVQGLVFIFQKITSSLDGKKV